jgi:hypothetical protein
VSLGAILNSDAHCLILFSQDSHILEIRQLDHSHPKKIMKVILIHYESVVHPKVVLIRNLVIDHQNELKFGTIQL